MEDTKMSLNDIVKKTISGVKTTGKKAYEIVKDTAKTVPALTLGAGLAYGVANADAAMMKYQDGKAQKENVPIVDIEENDGLPDVFSNPDKLYWTFSVTNNSAVQFDNVIQVLFKDIYSVVEPTVPGAPGAWGPTYSAGSAENLWDISLVAGSQSEIEPGKTGSFFVGTTKPADQEVVIGTLYGQGGLSSSGLSPLDSYQGPIGVPEPAPIVDIEENDGMYENPVPSNLNILKWDWTVTNNSGVQFDNVTQVLFKDVYSLIAPNFFSTPGAWGPTYSAGSAENLWDISLVAGSQSEIEPGKTGNFGVITTKPADQEVVIGTLYGQGVTNITGVQALDTYQGPVGIPEPATGIDDLLLIGRYWLQSGCMIPAECAEADFNLDEKIDNLDISAIADRWISTPP
jgi:hypothetical protein